MFSCTTGTWTMPIHSTPITNIFYFLGIYVMYILFLFLFLLILWRFVRIMTIIFVEINMSLMATFTTSTMTANHDHYYYYYYYSIHFKEWSWTSQSLFIISHQKLNILFNYKEIWNQFIIFLKTSFSTLLLQEHIRGMKSR